MERLAETGVGLSALHQPRQPRLPARPSMTFKEYGYDIPVDEMKAASTRRSAVKRRNPGQGGRRNHRVEVLPRRADRAGGALFTTLILRSTTTGS